MSHIGLADLLGARAKSIQWERPFLFFGALFLSDLVWLVISPFTRWLSSMGDTTWTYWVSPPHSWLLVFLADLLMAGLALIAFRLIPTAAVAIPAVAIVYALLSTLIRFVVFSMSYEEGLREQILAQLWRPTSLLFWAISTGCFLGGMALARPVNNSVLIGDFRRGHTDDSHLQDVGLDPGWLCSYIAG